MTKHKELFNLPLTDYKTYYDGKNYDTTLKVFGLFDTKKVSWSYFALSVISVGNSLYQTGDVSNGITSVSNLTASMLTTGMKFDTLEDAKAYLTSFKTKWETGKNKSLADIRDEKINKITGD